MRSEPGVIRRGSEAIREIVLVALAALAYFGIRNLTQGNAEAAYGNADRLMRFERAAGLAWETSLQAPVVARPALVTLFNSVYIWGHWPVIITIGILLFHYRRDRYLLLRDAILVSGAIGFLFFAFFPVAPPRLADPALVDTITLHSHAYRVLQPPGLTNQFAAFPSLHFGWNLLAGIAVWGATRSPVLRTLSVIGPAAMAAAVVLTANHYVIDVFAGLVVVLVGLVGHQVLVRLRLHSDADGPLHRPPRRQRPHTAPPSRAARL